MRMQSVELVPDPRGVARSRKWESESFQEQKALKEKR